MVTGKTCDFCNFSFLQLLNHMIEHYNELWVVLTVALSIVFTGFVIVIWFLCSGYGLQDLPFYDRIEMWVARRMLEEREREKKKEE
eukprot:gene4416-7791_t